MVTETDNIHYIHFVGYFLISLDVIAQISIPGRQILMLFVCYKLYERSRFVRAQLGIEKRGRKRAKNQLSLFLLCFWFVIILLWYLLSNKCLVKSGEHHSGTFEW